jgi:TonB-linked SusC/RagA family outer membrane protein
MRKIVSLTAMLLLLFTMAIAQTKTVTGKVTDESGNPLGFASVTIKGTKAGTAADADGKFSLKVKSGDVLIIGATGATPKEYTVGADNVLTIALSTKTAELTTVVVTSLGIKREAKSLGYATSTVTSEQINESKPVNAAQGLIGQVSGAQISIQNNGVDPSIRLQLRGERHINADNQALLVVDGIEADISFLANINPEDIDNMTVLKGASAAALYGAEATNGVVIVTTKRGSKNGKPSVSVKQTATAERLAYFPALQEQFSGYGGEQGTFFSGTPYAFTAVNPYTGFTNYIPFENQQYGPAYATNPGLPFIGSPNQYGQVDSVPFKPSGTDPRKAFFQTGITSQTDASVSFGDNQNSSFIGLQYVNVDGTVPNDMAQRENVRFAAKRTYGIFTIDYTINYSHKITNTVGNDFNGTPVYWNLLNTQANVPIAALKDWQDPNSWGNASNYYNAYYANPWWQIANSRIINKYDNLQGTINANLKITNWVSANYTLGAIVNNQIYESTLAGVTFNSFVRTDPWGEGNYESSGNKPGAVNNVNYYNKRFEQNASLIFQHKFADIDAKLIVGNDIWDRSYNYLQNNNSNLYIPSIYNVAYGTGISGASQYVTDTRLIGLYSDLSLNYKDFLFLHGNFRRDYSSLLATGHNNYNVYGVDAAVSLYDVIPALRKTSWLSFAKIRGAYSSTGQITLQPYSTVNTYGVSGGYPYGSLASLSLSQTYNNPSLVPEKTVEAETGIELAFLKNKINFGFTYYHDDNTNQLFPVSVTSATGYTNAQVNAAATTSKGYEFDLKLNRLVDSKNGLRVDLNANLAIQTTTVNSLYQGTQFFNIGNYNEAIVGTTFPQMYVQDLNRDPQGHVIVDGTTGLPSVNPNFIAVGRTTPKYILGLTPTISYQHFTLQVIADYRGGYVFYNNAEQQLDFTGASAHTAENGRQNFIYPNSVIETSPGKYTPNTNVYTQDGNIGFWVYSPYRSAGTSYVENAAAWKIRTISLKYDFTPLFGKYKFVKGFTLTALCNNALMFRPKQNDFTDPEFNYSNSNGYGYNTYYQLPPTRQYTFVLGLTF